MVSVRADNSVQAASRYYTGAGIYRHVHLIITDPVHIDNWGVFVTTPQVSAQKATVHVKTTVFNAAHDKKNVIVQTSLIGTDGKAGPSADSKAEAVESGQTVTIEQDITVNNPDLWNVDHPVLYKAISKIKTDKVVDEQTTDIGIRESNLCRSGFLLNGKKLMIKGVCLHHDGGAVGAAVPLRVWQRRLELLKQIGVNAIRTSHNPVSPEFLDLCDRMGFW